ncbi:MFS transporter [Pseudoxanthobacter sp.]|uniref:MFS transporter n=1 Tax=Pseudoxanthobacter sp. TaxID=1925742 RepID=UPI002FE14484
MAEIVHQTEAAPQAPSAALIAVVAFAAGSLVANLYYAQPLIGSIAPAIGISVEYAGAIVSVTQIGYGLGLLFLVSLADRVENRRLVLSLMGLTALGLAGVAFSTHVVPFFIASLLVGLCSCGAQVLIPFAVSLVPPKARGRVIGNVMAGALSGIMLARPLSLFVASAFGWRAIFVLSAVVMLAVAGLLARLMPHHRPQTGLSYGAILLSMADLLKTLPVLRWRSLYQALLFAAFHLLWTAAPLMLAERFGLSDRAIGLFALAGAGGALAAPLAGRLADAGRSGLATVLSMLLVGVGSLVSGWAAAGGMLISLAVLMVVVDAAVQTNQVVSQRIIFAAPAAVRGRVNGVYMTLVFVGGAIGSMLGTLTYHHGGWAATAATGTALGLGALALYGLETRAAGRQKAGA